MTQYITDDVRAYLLVVRRFCGLCCLGALLVCAGCATPDGLVAPAGPQYEVAEDPGNLAASTKELDSARRLLEAGEYSHVFPRLTNLISRYPDTPAAIEGRYCLGVAYYRISSYPDALAQFQDYLGQAPDGTYATASRQYVDLIEEEMAKHYQTPEQAAARVAQAEDRAAEQPGDLGRQLDLAEQYWRNGQYTEVGATYEAILRRWPQLEQDLVIRSRVERQPNGSLLVLSPDEMERRSIEAEPLLVYNTASFRSGRDSLYARALRDIYYHVSGQAVNRSKAPLQQVQVIVTLFGYGGMVYETQTVSLGTMPPGQVRAFSVQFSNFENIENIERFECSASYTR